MMGDRPRISSQLALRPLRFRVSADVDALWQRIVEDPDVRVSDDASPEPGPPHGAPLLASRRDARTIVVRHWSGPADAISPLLALHLSPRGDVVGVEAELQQPSTRAMPGEVREGSVWHIAIPIVALAAIVVLAWAVAGSGLLWALPLLLLLFAIPSALVMLPALALWNAESRRTQREVLMAWVGRVFVPIALPPGDDDDPFR